MWRWRGRDCTGKHATSSVFGRVATRASRCNVFRKVPRVAADKPVRAATLRSACTASRASAAKASFEPVPPPPRRRQKGDQKEEVERNLLDATLPVPLMMVFDLRHVYSTIIAILVAFYLVVMNLGKAWTNYQTICILCKFTFKLKLKNIE